MDEYILANAYYNFEELPKEVLQRPEMQDYKKIPFATLAAFGGGIAELVPAFRTITSTFDVDTKGLYRAINPKTGAVMELPFDSRQIAGAKIGGIMQADGKFDQAALMKPESLKGVVSSVAAINPAIIMLAAAVFAMSMKLDKIEETQKEILGFLEEDKRTALEGTLNFLLEVFGNYKYNWDNDMYKSNTHLKTQDIKQSAEGDILFFKNRIAALLDKKLLVPNRSEIRKNMRTLIDQFCAYRLSLYLYSFSSFLEVILLENHNKDYLKLLSEKIRDFSTAYTELYTKCYDWLLNLDKKSIEAGALKGLAAASKGMGQFINKIPVIERGQLDESLIKAGEKLDDFKEESTDSFLNNITVMRNSSVIQFAELIEQISDLYNNQQDVLFDSENIYVRLTA